MNQCQPRTGSPRLATPTDLGANAAKDIAGAFNAFLADSVRTLSQDKEFPLARKRPAFPRLPLAAR